MQILVIPLYPLIVIISDKNIQPVLSGERDRMIKLLVLPAEPSYRGNPFTLRIYFLNTIISCVRYV